MLGNRPSVSDHAAVLGERGNGRLLVGVAPCTTRLKVTRIGAVGDTGNRTSTGPGDHGVATLCDH